MACANNNCPQRTWCEERTRESIKPEDCEQFKIINQWWHDKISGLRDPFPDDDEEIPFSDEDFGEGDFQDG